MACSRANPLARPQMDPSVAERRVGPAPDPDRSPTKQCAPVENEPADARGPNVWTWSTRFDRAGLVLPYDRAPAVRTAGRRWSTHTAHVTHQRYRGRSGRNYPHRAGNPRQQRQTVQAAAAAPGRDRARSADGQRYRYHACSLSRQLHCSERTHTHTRRGGNNKHTHTHKHSH